MYAYYTYVRIQNETENKFNTYYLLIYGNWQYIIVTKDKQSKIMKQIIRKLIYIYI